MRIFVALSRSMLVVDRGRLMASKSIILKKAMDKTRCLGPVCVWMGMIYLERGTVLQCLAILEDDLIQSQWHVSVPTSILTHLKLLIEFVQLVTLFSLICHVSQAMLVLL